MSCKTRTYLNNVIGASQVAERETAKPVLSAVATENTRADQVGARMNPSSLDRRIDARKNIPLLADISVETIAQFKRWTRTHVRTVFPHGALVCGCGHRHAGGFAIDYVVAIDYPIEHLQSIRNRAGGIDTPILRRSIATWEPQLFEPEWPWPDIPEHWLDSFRRHNLGNTAALAFEDAGRCVGTYHSFHRIPGPLTSAHAVALKRIVPIMHKLLCSAIDHLTEENPFKTLLSGLTNREYDLLRWLRISKTNAEIAQLTELSENTVKHHLSSIYDKLGVENRTQLVRKLIEYEFQAEPGYATKIL